MSLLAKSSLYPYKVIKDKNDNEWVWVEVPKTVFTTAKNADDYNNIKADLYLSIESGINNSLGRWMITNIAVIEDNFDFESYGTSPSFPVPDRLAEDVIRTDLSQVMDKVLGEDKERHNQKGGIQLLTHNKVTRVDLTEMAFIMALTKYINGDTWK